MKHKVLIIVILVSIFFVSQVVGLYVTNKHAEKERLPLNIERPQIENKSASFIPITIFIVIATVIGLLLMKFNLGRLWKVWFFFGIFFTLVISFSAFIDEKFAIIFGLIFAFWRVLKNNAIIHNFTEIFIYGALSAIISPILNTLSAFALLFIISVYDYIAVRKTKHMIELAKFQGKSKMFAGLMVPYQVKADKNVVKAKIDGVFHGKKLAKINSEEERIAILGGGDMGFPLLFAAVAMAGFGLTLSDIQSYIIPAFSTLALAGLFMLGSDKKFYPAMPYITAGCTVGYVILWLLV